MLGKMLMTFSQSGRMVDMFGTSIINAKKDKNISMSTGENTVLKQIQPQIRVNQDQYIQRQANDQSRIIARRIQNGSTSKNIKQLFNLGHIMANTGTPCRACGS